MIRFHGIAEKLIADTVQNPGYREVARETPAAIMRWTIFEVLAGSWPKGEKRDQIAPWDEAIDFHFDHSDLPRDRRDMLMVSAICGEIVDRWEAEGILPPLQPGL